MRKTLVLILSVFLLLVFIGLLYGQHQHGSPPSGAGPHRGMGMGMMDSSMHARMQSHMKEHRMMPAMVPSGDGGVILMAGKKLYKYDKNLVLKKEAEIKLDSAALHPCMPQ